jgi:hypothetical protein
VARGRRGRLKSVWRRPFAIFASQRDSAIETYVDGEGPTILILPSYGRDSGDDFDDITRRSDGELHRPLAGAKPEVRGLPLGMVEQAEELHHGIDLVEDLDIQEACDLRLKVSGHSALTGR